MVCSFGTYGLRQRDGESIEHVHYTQRLCAIILLSTIKFMCVQRVEQRPYWKMPRTKKRHTSLARSASKNKTARLSNRCTNIKSLPDIFSQLPNEKIVGSSQFIHDILENILLIRFDCHIWLVWSAHINKMAIGLGWSTHTKKKNVKSPIEIHWIVWIFAYIQSRHSVHLAEQQQKKIGPKGWMVRLNVLLFEFCTHQLLRLAEHIDFLICPDYHIDTHSTFGKF